MDYKLVFRHIKTIDRSKTVFFIFFILTQGLYGQSQFHKKLQSQFVYIMSHNQKKDLMNPWRSGNIYKSTCLGAIIRKKDDKNIEILTTAKCIKEANYIEMKYFFFQKKQSVELLYVDYEINLAVLSTNYPNNKLNLSPVDFSDPLKINDKATLVSAKSSDHFYTQDVSLQSYKVMSSPTSSYYYLQSGFLAQKANMIGAEFILKNEQLVGIVNTVRSNTCNTIPSNLIKIFLENYRSNGQKSFSSLEIKTRNLNSENLRKSLKTNKIRGGVRVYHVEEVSPFYKKLEPNDVLYKFNEYTIDRKGYITHPLYGKVRFQGLVAEHTGTDITVEILRKGKVKRFKSKKTPHNSNQALIPHSRISKVEPHLIVGGLVFQELTFEYLKTWGKNWINKAPSYLGAIWKLNNHKNKKLRRIILLSQVLPDSINNGYQKVHNAMIESINDQPIDSLDDLKYALSKPLLRNNKKYLRVNLRYGDGSFILPYSDLNKSHQRIAQKYKIANQDSFYNPKRVN